MIVVFTLLAAIVMNVGINRTFAQSQLMKLSQQQESEWRTGRAVAESIATRNHTPIRIDRPDGQVLELQRFEGGIPRVYTTYNLTSAKTISTDKVWSGAADGFELSGITETLGEWDGGAPLTTHQEFGGRIVSTQGTVISHATHVAGTLIGTGVQAAAHGMSYHGLLQAYDWNSDAGEMAAAAASGLQVSNHSYGLITGWTFNFFNDSRWVWFGDTTISSTQDYRFGFYDLEARSWDNVAYNAPYYLIDKSAGNDRREGPTSQPVVHWIFDGLGQHVLSNTFRDVDGVTTGYRTLNGAATSKNVLVVGAVNGIPNGYHVPSDVVMSSFSCWGPTNDGRVKPDIVADGVSLYSANSASNGSYATLSGTSMATPSVTGSVGLLLEYQRNLHGTMRLRSSTLRGLLLHTADDAGNIGPDYTFGWGLMNTLSAARLMRRDSADGLDSHIREVELLSGDTLRINLYSDGSKPLRVTICWTDPPGTPPPHSLNPPTIMLVNDVDFRVIRQSDQTVYSPWVLNPSSPSAGATTGDNVRDNIEQVIVPTTSLGVYVARISHKSTLSGGSQFVSLIVSGNLPYYKPIISVLPSGGSYMRVPGTVTQESLKVYNRGDRELMFAATTQTPWLVVDTSMRNIPPLDSAFLHFSLDATLLSQWSTYDDTILIASNDTANSQMKLPFTLATSGPRILVSVPALYVNTDSGIVAPYRFTIHNVGTQPLTFNVADDDTVPSPWLSLGFPAGTIGVGESTQVTLAFDATLLSPGTYGASLKITSTDSSTGDVMMPVILNVFSGITIQTSMNNNWNMVSLPVTPADNLKVHLYPTARSGAFSYSGSYQAQGLLVPGIGYWLKFNGIQAVEINGTRLAEDSISVAEGWNLIGAISYPVPVSTVRSTPPGMTTSRFFGYSGSYVISDILMPGKAYWVKVNESGQLVLSSLTAVALPSGTIRVSPTTELPPPPPDGIGSVPKQKPTSYALEQNYPNPFNPSTTIRYALPVDSRVTLTMYNVLGEEVARPVDSELEPAGFREVQFDAGTLSSGMYYYRMNAIGADDSKDRFVQIRKMVVVR